MPAKARTVLPSDQALPEPPAKAPAPAAPEPEPAAAAPETPVAETPAEPAPAVTAEPTDTSALREVVFGIGQVAKVKLPDGTFYPFNTSTKRITDPHLINQLTKLVEAKKNKLRIISAK